MDLSPYRGGRVFVFGALRYPSGSIDSKNGEFLNIMRYIHSPSGMLVVQRGGRSTALSKRNHSPSARTRLCPLRRSRPRTRWNGMFLSNTVTLLCVFRLGASNESLSSARFRGVRWVTRDALASVSGDKRLRLLVATRGSSVLDAEWSWVRVATSVASKGHLLVWR